MPDRAAWRENDTDLVTVPMLAQSGLPASDPTTPTFDISPFFGRVGYVYGGATDKPIAVLRFGYRDNALQAGSFFPPGYYTFVPFALYPQWDMRAEPALGSTADGGLWPCTPTNIVPRRCSGPLAWTGLWAPNGVAAVLPQSAWVGSLLEDKREGSGLSYRRNRYLDPANGRFTQLDPIGLGGGINSYGYASGDPVNFSDPFGLCPGIPGTDAFSVSDCPPGYFRGVGLVVGSISGLFVGRGAGAALGAGGGEVACIGVPVCGIAGAAVGQRIGGRVGARALGVAGARLGTLIDLVLENRREEKRIRALIRQVTGRKETEEEYYDVSDEIHSDKEGPTGGGSRNGRGDYTKPELIELIKSVLGIH
jgi:RHS repeat-associated protein